MKRRGLRFFGLIFLNFGFIFMTFYMWRSKEIFTETALFYRKFVNFCELSTYSPGPQKNLKKIVF